VAGEDQGDHLVAELAVSHAASPLVVAGGQQTRQQVILFMAALTMSPYNAINNLVDLPDGLPVPPGRGPRQIVEKPKPARRAHEVFGDDFDRLTDDVGLASQLGAEQRLGGNRECQLPHVLVRVAHLAVAPRFEHAFGVLDHHGGVALDLLALKLSPERGYLSARAAALIRGGCPLALATGPFSRGSRTQSVRVRLKSRTPKWSIRKWDVNLRRAAFEN
jgi:hypothetical protein